MATLTNWVQHLTTDVDAATEGIQVAGAVYPYVGTELWWVLAGIVFWIWWEISTSAGEDEEHKKLARKKYGANDYKSNITEW
jgi:hypothetical protein